MIDNYVGAEVYAGGRPYVLHASEDTETALTDTQEQTYIDNHGDLIFQAKYRPVIKVLSGTITPSLGSGQFGGQPIPFDMNNVEWQGRTIFHYGPFTGFGYGTALRVSVTYLDGFANALLTADAALHATSLTVDDLTGFQPGQEVTLYDMPPEQVFVASSFTTATGPGSLPLAGQLAFAHTAGARISALADDAKQAALFLVQHLVQTRGLMQAQAAWSLLGERAVPMGPTDYRGMAMELLQNYRLTAF